VTESASRTNAGLPGVALSNSAQSLDVPRDGLSGPLLTVLANPDPMTVGVRVAPGWEAGLVLPVEVSESISATLSPTAIAVVITTVTTPRLRASGRCAMAVMYGPPPGRPVVSTGPYPR